MPLPVIVAPMVGWIITAGAWLARSQVGTVLALALAWFGINYVTLTVVLTPALDILEGVMNGASSAGSASLAGVMWQWFLVLKFPGALTMVVSAYTTKVAVRGATGVFVKATS